tara:strand:- start:2317 stop:3543 length:1227 start_codon:yes stop_codon:yes gene_type:complete
MEESEKKIQGKKESIVTTFTVSSFEEKEGTISINTNTPSNSSKEQIIKQAFKFHSEGNIKEAIKHYKYFIDQGFHDHIVFSNYGSILKDIGRNKAAGQLFIKAIELDPDFAEAHCNLGGVLIDLGHLQEAEISLRKSIKINPNIAQSHYYLAKILKGQNKSEEAELLLLKSIELKPSCESLFLYASCLYENRKFEASKEKLYQAASLSKKINFKSLIYAAIKSVDYAKNNGANENFDRLILNRPVESELINYLYTLKNQKLNNTCDARFGNGVCSEDFELFNDPSPIIQKLSMDLQDICKKELGIKEIQFSGTFFNIFVSGSGAKAHDHIKTYDKEFNLTLNKFSLVYYLDVGDQSGDEPGILKLYAPDEDILPTNGMIVIIDCKQKHSVSYRGKKDRVMVGFNFYGF